VETAIVCGRVITDEKSKKKKSLVTVYRLSDLAKPVKEMTVSVCDRMKIKISPDRKNVLLQSISDDTSATSYYGESSLYFLDLLYGKFQKISLPEGPIHDFDWTPNSENFIICAGYQPAKTHIYNNTGKFLKEICVSKVSTIRISPDSRILCMAGFGNLNGDIEIFRMSDFKIIGKTKLYCGVSLNWSKDSKYLVGAVLSPRVRVDNEYRIFSYHGEDVVGEKFNGEIYECEWVDNSGKFILIHYIDFKFDFMFIYVLEFMYNFQITKFIYLFISNFLEIEYNEFELIVSEVYLKKLEIEKQKQKNAPSLSNNLNNLSLSSAPKSKGIPGMKKK
jgi:uncharacterized protein with WD repeat